MKIYSEALLPATTKTRWPALSCGGRRNHPLRRRRAARAVQGRAGGGAGGTGASSRLRGHSYPLCQLRDLPCRTQRDGSRKQRRDPGNAQIPHRRNAGKAHHRLRRLSYSVSDGHLVTREQLDSVCSDRPIFIVKYDGHACVINTPLLNRLRESSPPSGDTMRTRAR